MWQQFCSETTLHGFREMSCARFRIFKLFWFIVIIVGASITCYQLYKLVDQFSSTPTETSIKVLPADIEVRYPPITFQLSHFSEWINLTKVIELDFDLYSLSLRNVISSADLL